MTTRASRHREPRSRQRSALLTVPAEHTSYRSAAELFSELRTRGHPIGLVTVYRHLEAMSRQGTVTTMPGQRGETRYRLRAPATGDRCPLVCIQCRQVVDVAADGETRWARTTATEHGFVDVQVLFMVTGVCGHCHTTPPA
jgi:Fur family transcriptional regulator, ferric uptake regulator